jgi:hypothetical protein
VGAKERDVERGRRLPLRWAVILSISVALGVSTSGSTSPVVGLTVGMAAVGLLWKILGE